MDATVETDAASAVECEYSLDTAPEALKEVSFRDLARAAIPTFDRATGRADVQGGSIGNCRGDRVTATFEDPYHQLAVRPPRGTVKNLGHVMLPDGREAVWFGVGASPLEALQEERGFLAIVRLDGRRLAVDAIGAWQNCTASAERSLEAHIIGGERVFVERRHFAGTGAGLAEDGVQIWHETEGHIVLAGTYLTTAVQNAAMDLPDGKCGWDGRLVAKLFYGADLRIDERLVWDREDGDGNPCKTDSGHKEAKVMRLAHWSGDKLVETSPRKDLDPLNAGPPP